MTQLDFLLTQLPNLLIGFPNQRPGGLLLTIFLAAGAIMVGFLIALGIGIAQRSPRPFMRLVARLYADLLRGIPLILLVLIIHTVMGNGRRWGINTSPLLSAMIALTLYSSAYQAEIVRAGLDAVPPHLVESARLLGSSPGQAYRLIQLRYTVHVMLPALTGQAISLFKDSSVVVIIGVAELMTVAKIALGSNVANAPYWVSLYLTVGALYFAVAFTLSRLAHHWERRRRPLALVHSLANY